MSTGQPELHVKYLEAKKEADSLRREIARIQDELTCYKGTVKQLAYELEMAQTDWSTSSMARALDKARRSALQQASDFLMDHGTVATGPELVEVCEQIARLHVTSSPTQLPQVQEPWQ